MTVPALSRPSKFHVKPRRQRNGRLTYWRFVDLVGNEALAMHIIQSCGGHRVPQLTALQRKRLERADRARQIVNARGYRAAAEATGLSISWIKQLSKRDPESTRRKFLAELASRQAHLAAELATIERTIAQLRAL